MPIKITVTEWTIPAGHDCQFGDNRPCPFLKGWEYSGDAYCVIEKNTPLELSRRQTWKKTQTCSLRLSS